MKERDRVIRIKGTPNERQRLFFSSKARYTAYGGARGGGKSWALRRKLVGLCLRYPSIRCLLVRRSLSELKANHVRPLLSEYEGLIDYSESEKRLSFPNGSSIALGYCSSIRDTLRYQGQEYDIIAIDEATQLTEYQFEIFKACLRGVSDCPRRMYLTCNPGGIGHAWVKRLFVDRDYREGEDPADYRFIAARVYDNPILLEKDPDYVKSLESLPDKLREAWLHGRWDVFSGQFFPEFSPAVHTVEAHELPPLSRRFLAFDYGLDMLAALIVGLDAEGNVYVERELALPDRTLSEAARELAAFVRESGGVTHAVASPDLWNRRQDSGRSGMEIMQAVPGMPPLTPADDRRIPGWRVLRDTLCEDRRRARGEGGSTPLLRISRACRTLIESLPQLLCDTNRPEDALDEPHAATHAPEALRYALMSRVSLPSPREEPDRNFRFLRTRPSLYAL